MLPQAPDVFSEIKQKLSFVHVIELRHEAVNSRWLNFVKFYSFLGENVIAFCDDAVPPVCGLFHWPLTPLKCTLHLKNQRKNTWKCKFLEEKTHTDNQTRYLAPVWIFPSLGEFYNRESIYKSCLFLMVFTNCTNWLWDQFINSCTEWYFPPLMPGKPELSHAGVKAISESSFKFNDSVGFYYTSILPPA